MKHNFYIKNCFVNLVKYKKIKSNYFKLKKIKKKLIKLLNIFYHYKKNICLVKFKNRKGDNSLIGIFYIFEKKSINNILCH